VKVKERTSILLHRIHLVLARTEVEAFAAEVDRTPVVVIDHSIVVELAAAGNLAVGSIVGSKEASISFIVMICNSETRALAWSMEWGGDLRGLHEDDHETYCASIE